MIGNKAFSKLFLLHLIAWASVSIARSQTTINVPPQAAPSSIAGDITLNLYEEGILPSRFSAGSGSRVNVLGGVVRWGFEAQEGSQVDVHGGLLGDFEALRGSRVNIFGGEFSGDFEAHGGSLVTIADGEFQRGLEVRGGRVVVTGGNFGRDFYAGGPISIDGGTFGDGFDAAGVITMTGGSIGSYFSNQEPSHMRVMGGTFGRGFNYQADYDTQAGGRTVFHGDEFLINGEPLVGSTIQLQDRDILTGTLADGSTFLFTPHARDDLRYAEFVTVPLEPVDPTPIFATAPLEQVGLRPGQTLFLQEGGSMRDDAAIAHASLTVAGGSVGEEMESTNSSVNLQAGSIGDRFHAYDGTDFLMTGGRLGNLFQAYPRSKIRIEGGTVGAQFTSHLGAEVRLVGGEFLVNGEAPKNSRLRLSGDEKRVLSGTLSDGTVVVFASSAQDLISNLILVNSPLPPVDLSPMTLNDDQAPRGLRAGQTLTVIEGGVLPDDFATVGAILNVQGGEVGNHIEVVDSSVNISGGSVGERFTAYAGSVVSVSGGLLGIGAKAEQGSIFNVTGGEIEHNFSAQAGSVVNVSGGTLTEARALAGSVLNISGGTFPGSLDLAQGSTVHISGGDFLRGLGQDHSGFPDEPTGNLTITGGTFHEQFRIPHHSGATIAGGEFLGSLQVQGPLQITGGSFRGALSIYAPSHVEISGGTFGRGFETVPAAIVGFRGGEFLINGAPLDGTFAQIDETDILTGTLADGSVFLFSRLAGDLQSILGDPLQTLTFESVQLPEAAPRVLVQDAESAPHGVRPGQTLVAVEGGVLPADFAAVGAILSLNGGETAGEVELMDSFLTLSEGTIGGDVWSYTGSQVNISGGQVDGKIWMLPGSNFQMSGGKISPGLSPRGGPTMEALLVNENAEAKISGGVVEGRTEVLTGGTLDLHGGDLQGALYVRDGGELNLYGSEFLLDAQPIEELNLGEPLLLTELVGILSGRLSDGTPFVFPLSPQRRGIPGVVEQGAALTITLVPEPSALALTVTAMLLCSQRRSPLRFVAFG